MNYELAKKLKDAGFPQISRVSSSICDEGSLRNYDIEPCFYPNLSELIEACGDRFKRLETCKVPDIETNIEKTVWFAYSEDDETTGYTPEEAMAKLWLELNKKI